MENLTLWFVENADIMISLLLGGFLATQPTEKDAGRANRTANLLRAIVGVFRKKN